MIFQKEIGFGLMGFIGFFVKLIHIPINNIVVGGLGEEGRVNEGSLIFIN